jgi:farnesyl-diphosphate farnesyltransferase
VVYEISARKRNFYESSMEHRSSDLLKELLPEVSRSFYLTLRALPRRVRSQIGLAYLMARTSDTIADTSIIPVDERLETLQQFRARVTESTARFDLGELAAKQSLPAEKVLLERMDAVWSAFESLGSEDKQSVRKVLLTITSGQELDVRRFAGADQNRIVALQTDHDLEDYIYRVAGCVGEFWTEMCRRHLFPGAQLNDTALLSESIAFGKGLQLVNVLRDLPADLRQGRCYLPAEELARAGLKPADLLTNENISKVRPLYDACLDRAESYLAAGWSYTNRLPYGCVRVRLACAWPVLIGLRTLQRLRSANVLDARQRVKVSRRDVRNIVISSVLAYPVPFCWKKLFPQTSPGKPGKRIASPAIFE